MFRLLILFSISSIPAYATFCSNLDQCWCDGQNEVFCQKNYHNSSDLRKEFVTASQKSTEEEKHFAAIQLSFSNITELASDVFADITFRVISINSMHALRKISSTAFRYSNPYLRQIKITYSPIDLIDSDDYNLFYALSSMRYLQTVVLRETNLCAIPDYAFKRLSVAQNLLKSIEIFDNKNLTTLGSGAFDFLNNLTLINLSANKLKAIESNVFHITNVDNNPVTINLSNNLIESIASNAFLVNTSFKVDLNNNLISVMEKNSFASNTPMSVDLSNNSLADSRIFVESFTYLNAVRLLDISGNNLTKIESNSFPLTDSKYNNMTINLSRNQIALIETNSFSSNDTSMRIDLSVNKLTSNSFSANAFTNISKPSTIILADNPELKYLNQSLFESALLAGHLFTFERIVLTCECEMYWILLNRTQYMKQLLYAVCDDGFSLFDETRLSILECE